MSFLHPDREPRRGRQAGFSLLELMITMVIIFVLAMMALPLSKNIAKRAKETELKQRLQILRKAIDDFNRDWNRDGDNLLGSSASRTNSPAKR
ncbi:MAG: type II secretion system protein [Candidatus Manganitrophus sp.]|nr:MAG: type II secretion system protein [Candidatus Manganitrophus sp.]